jgi:tetratricopeptide (TPR) repeat protein
LDNYDQIVKLAKDCHTKQAWEQFFNTHGETLASANTAKPLQEVFRLLKDDPQSLQYEPKILGQLIRGCLSCWDLELGGEISEFAKKIPSAEIAIPAAQLHLEAGHLSTTREIAGRSLRLTGLQANERLQLEMIICNSYSEEGKHSKAQKILKRIEPELANPALDPQERADFIAQVARMRFWLGDYQQAGDMFYQSAEIYRTLEDWEAAARFIFNTAACYLNAGVKGRDMAFAMVEECRRIAEENDLAGTLAHCDAAYGMDHFQHGNFPAAREHFRSALDHLPISDKSYRRQHILSMLANTYMAMGRYHLARKFGQQTIDLAALDESHRIKTRYTTLEAELMWQDGSIEESQALLAESVAPFESRGIHILEEQATLSRFNLQSALLGDTIQTAKYKIDRSLARNTHSWLERMFSLGQLHLNANEFEKAEELFDVCLKEGRETSDRMNVALGLLGKIQIHLKQRKADQTHDLAREFDIAVARIGETPFKTQTHFIQAAVAYQTGDFAGVEKIFKRAAKGTRQSFHDKFLIQCCIATIEGRSPRLTADWQAKLMARFTRTYFAPTLARTGPKQFQVSEHFNVNLERYPALADLLNYLLLRNNFSASTSDIQTHVWQQSLNSQGWKQKIRNTIMRVRDFFPYTIAPIILHSDEISLFKEAIRIEPSRREGLDTEQEIIRLISDGPMSTNQLTNRLKLSPATVKRILKKLHESEQIRSVKEGRNVFYEPRA